MKKAPVPVAEEVKEPSFWKDELNLAEFPIALLTERAPTGVRTLEFKDQIFDSGKKKLLNRKLTIEGSETYGLPTAKDDEVILALIQLSKRKGFNEKKLEFTRYELISVLGWPNTGQSYLRILLALRRWVSVTLHYENAWWDKSEERWTSGAFHIIDDFELNDSRENTLQLTLLSSRIIWSARVFDSFVVGHLKNIRYDIYVKLRSAVSKRMFRFLDKRFYINKSVSFDLRDFAHEHIGLSRAYRDCGKLKEKLELGIRELEEIGFIEPLSRDDRYRQEGRGRWRVSFTRKPDAPSPSSLPVPVAELETSPLVQALVSRGASAKSAAELVATKPEADILAKLEVFDWLKETNDKGLAASPAGYLVKSIQDDYATPKGFVSKAERQRLAAASLDRGLKAAKERQAKQEAAERERVENAAVATYWDSLSQAERTELEAAALAATDLATMELATGSMKRLGLAIARNQYIRNLLIANGTLPATVE